MTAEQLAELIAHVDAIGWCQAGVICALIFAVTWKG